MNKSKINTKIIELKSELQMYKDIAAYRGYDKTRKSKSGDAKTELILYNPSFKYKVSLDEACEFIADYADFTLLKCFEGYTNYNKRDEYLRAWTIKCIKDIKNRIKALRKLK